MQDIGIGSPICNNSSCSSRRQEYINQLPSSSPLVHYQVQQISERQSATIPPHSHDRGFSHLHHPHNYHLTCNRCLSNGHIGLYCCKLCRKEICPRCCSSSLDFNKNFNSLAPGPGAYLCHACHPASDFSIGDRVLIKNHNSIDMHHEIHQRCGHKIDQYLDTINLMLMNMGRPPTRGHWKIIFKTESSSGIGSYYFHSQSGELIRLREDAQECFREATPGRELSTSRESRTDSCDLWYLKKSVDFKTKNTIHHYWARLRYGGQKVKGYNFEPIDFHEYNRIYEDFRNTREMRISPEVGMHPYDTNRFYLTPPHIGDEIVFIFGL